jgi:uncharacterized lipoprotein YmbA
MTMAARFLAAGFLLLLAACASTPEPRFYSLSALPAPAFTSSGGASTASMASTASVSVGPVSLPAALDRPQIVVSTSANEVRLDDLNRWAAPLQDNLAEVIVQNLVGLLGTPHVSVFPKMPAADAQYRVAVEVQRFESAPGTAAVLDASWTVLRKKDRTTQAGRTHVREPVQDASYDALVAAHSRAAGRLSEDIARAVRGLDAI